MLDIFYQLVLAMDKINETYNLISPEETTTGDLTSFLRKNMALTLSIAPFKGRGLVCHTCHREKLLYNWDGVP